MTLRGTKTSRFLRILCSDLEYIYLNCIINRIPSWAMRRLLYKTCGLRMGRNSRIGIGTKIVCPRRIVMGRGCIVNEYCHLDGRGGLFIENDVSISIYCRIISASHRMNSDEFEFQSHPIRIKDHSFIGAGATVLEGTLLETGCVIGAGSVVKGHYKSNTCYAGNPATFLRKRECDCNYKLKHEAFFR